VFTQAIVHLGGGGTITINAPAAANNAPYVQSLNLDGSAWNNAYLPPSFALNAGRSTSPSVPPPTPRGDRRIVGAPVVQRQRRQPAADQSGRGDRPDRSAIAGKCADVDHSGHRRRHQGAAVVVQRLLARRGRP